MVDTAALFGNTISPYKLYGMENSEGCTPWT